MVKRWIESPQGEVDQKCLTVCERVEVGEKDERKKREKKREPGSDGGLRHFLTGCVRGWAVQTDQSGRLGGAPGGLTGRGLVRGELRSAGVSHSPANCHWWK